MKQQVILGLSGGIAVVKAQEIITKLQQNNLDVVVIMTAGASEMISPETLKKENKIEVYANLFEKPVDTKKILQERKVEHIQVAGNAQAIVIAPATANIIAKLANGIADDYVTTTVLAATCPIIICPSMNVHMWHHLATQENVKKLKALGYTIIDPDSGMLACGYEGQGRLANIDTIVAEVVAIITKSTKLKGQKIVITSGGTKEYIDDVRFISNKSSGKMGVALAESCFLQGAEVVLLRAKNSLEPKYNIRQILFETAEELEAILQREIKDTQVVFHAAAVSDFSVEKQHGKISSEKEVILKLIPKEKIISKISSWNKKTKIIAFKAETGTVENLLVKAKQRLEQTNIYAIVANVVGKKSGFEVDTNEVYILQKTGEEIHIPLNTKQQIAQRIIEILL
ncbi:MAG TPA: bifunctional phosphopantothenoylcysteine decarboxylase/phosphopantothenate--cysteine ligase CoaBC [Patescibacteria group bacterium]